MRKEGNYQNKVLIKLILNTVLTCTFDFVGVKACLYVKQRELRLNDAFFLQISYG